MWATYALLLWLSHNCLQPNCCNDCFACYGHNRQGLVLVLLRPCLRPPQAYWRALLAVRLVSAISHLHRCRCTEGQGILPAWPIERLSLVGGASSRLAVHNYLLCHSCKYTKVQGLLPVQPVMRPGNCGCAGAWGYLLPSPGQELLWSGTGPCWGYL